MIAERPAPPILFELDPATGAGLTVASPHPGSATGQPFSEASFADFILDTELSLADAADEDRAGVFFRQSEDERYVGCTLSGAGQLSLGLVDGGPPMVIASADLAGDPHFHAGVNAINRLTVVSCGPVAAVLVNGRSILGALLDRRYVSGRIGALLVHTSNAPHASLLVHRAQARAIIG